MKIFRCSRRPQPIVESREREAVASLALQIDAACELNGVAGPQSVTHKQGLSIGRQLRRHLDDDPGAQVGVQGGDRAIALGCGKSAFARATRRGGCDFDLG